jgi:threonine synthase
MEVFCPECGRQSTLTSADWRCHCGGAWEPQERYDFDAQLIDRGISSLWRYRHLFGPDFVESHLSLSASWTPIVEVDSIDRSIWLKLDFLTPTGSFKDRGTEFMMNVLVGEGVAQIAGDSSGNAGASVAAYAAYAGIRADIFVPSYASLAKQAQIAVYGAHVHSVQWPRDNARLAAWNAVASGAVLASHAYHRAFLLGQQSMAWEVWEQMGREVPDWLIVPLGQGVHLLGAWLGFRRLRAAQAVDRIPRLVGVPPAVLAPVAEALEAGLDHVPALELRGTSIAEGHAIAPPVRGQRLLQAIRESDGLCVTVQEHESTRAHGRLAHRGLFVEPTSATAFAAFDVIADDLQPDDTIVIVLTGSGLKGSPVGIQRSLGREVNW